MDFSQFLQELGVYGHLTALLLGMPRLFALVTVAPFLGSAVVTSQIRLLLVLALYLPLHPVIVSHLTDEITLSAALSLAVGGKLALLLLKEAVLGLMIGFLAGIVFWTVQSAGFFMDNQRGASMAEGTDILSGDQSSPLGQLLFQSLVYIFYTSGAPLYFAEKVGWLMGHMLLLAGPIAAACLLTDVALGLINRFASQLNVYVLAMPIKCGIAAFLLCFYFGLLLSHAPELFDFTRESILKLNNLL
ncbi:EscT/YscT/HrcT family type III secretion system export apparatus protein, partial [Desulfovibrio sp.]|uniref:EscT/YscT/HrcT family type III secretion system export apparatus protein n=1 Tax=Desulfovibrio sp. TaxID=885 RepID=UPI003FF14FBA